MELPEEEARGMPAWVMTFADLMSLLMCFFVLLLSFSEIDAQRFKQIAGELAKAFFDDSEARFVNAALDGVARDRAGNGGAARDANA